METHDNNHDNNISNTPSFQNPDMQALYAGVMAGMQETIREALSNPILLNHLAEEIADRIDGFDDRSMGRLMDEAAKDSQVVSEDEIMQVLKS